MKLKKYGKGGSYKMYQNGGPVKAKKMPKEELERDAKMAKERLEELAEEKEYLKKRKEADRQYRMALKEGATEEQATKIAEKYLGGFKNGGKVGEPHKEEFMKARKKAYIGAKLKGRVAEAKFLKGNSRKEAEAKFDKATKYDNMLGRSSNPYKK